MTNKILDIVEMEEDFFEEAVLVGIVSAQPAYRLCWIINQHFDLNFIREPEHMIPLKKKDNTINHFPYFTCDLAGSSQRYLLYQLKINGAFLLPETKNMDYVWLLQTGNSSGDAQEIARGLRSLQDVQLATVLMPSQLKNAEHLII